MSIYNHKGIYVYRKRGLIVRACLVYYAQYTRVYI